ncbi:hypothetical protein UlMin_045942 [Ulmus minor]
MKVPHRFLLMFGLILLCTKATSQPSLSGSCLQSCGSIKIPYPFGTRLDCAYDSSFLLTCNRTLNSHKLFFPASDVSILSISANEGELRVEGPVARDCYDQQGNNITNSSSSLRSMFTHSNFPLSIERNMFAGVGCDTLAVIAGSRRRNIYPDICYSSCIQGEELKNGSCSGIGCCQTKIPKEVYGFSLNVASLNNHSEVEVSSYKPCGYGFVVEAVAYNFSTVDLRNFHNETVPVVLDWAVGNLTCEQAQQNRTSFACKASKSMCLNSTNGPGYRCRCLGGFEGNPYLDHGCKDIDECAKSKPCFGDLTCTNSEGSYSCSKCPKGLIGDGRLINGPGCTRVHDGEIHSAKILAIALGISVGLLLLVLAGSWINWNLKKRKLIQMKEKLFQQNGGLILQQQLFHQRGSAETAKIFTAEELKKATNNYDETRVLGQGGYGTVYKGVLTDEKVVAIKKSKIGNQSQIEQFINEVVVLSQINHRNVVKLLGCCLETEVPLLVYEFITNGTLSDHVHEKNIHSSLPWEMRLKIGTETAGAIAYLHSSTVMPIIHRDIKSTNILLDENYTAKVADFGASRLIPLDQTQLTTLVQGTLGYLDPEYFQTSQLTEKSDVYSFGVVLAELLTGEKALSFDKQECNRNLAMQFISSMKEELLLQILDKNLIIDGKVEQIKAVANVALSCLRVRGADRPTMKEVAGELEGLKYKGVHPRRKDHDLLSSEETEYLLQPSLLSVEEGRNGGSSTITNGRFDSMSIEVLKPYDDGGR